MSTFLDDHSARFEQADARALKADAARPSVPRQAWVVLAVGACLFPLTQVQTVVPVAAWVAPILLLRFSRLVRPRTSLPVLALVFYVGTLIASRDTFGLGATALIALGSSLMLLPYWLDRALGRRLGPGARTLVFPAAEGAIVFGLSFGTWATMGHSAYTQVAELPLLQITAVTGIWGLGFLVMWAAPVVNELWERGLDLRATSVTSRAFAVILLAVLMLGGARLAFAPMPDDTVRVAALAPDRDLRDRAYAADVAPGHDDPAMRASVTDTSLRPLLTDLLARTRQAADDGAQLVAWSEAATLWYAADEAELLAEAAQVADEEDLYLQIGAVFSLAPEQAVSNENRAVLFGPDGALLWDYEKTLVVPGDGNAPGPGIVPVVDTPFGRLATVICFDADRPGLVRQAGRQGADIVLVPTSDWEGIEELHARMVVPRAVENGVTIVRPTAQGIGLVVDPLGRVLAEDRGYFVDEHHTMTADVPTEGVPTVYRLVGDSLAWLNVAALLSLAIPGIVRGVRSRRRAA